MLDKINSSGKSKQDIVISALELYFDSRQAQNDSNNRIASDRMQADRGIAERREVSYLQAKLDEAKNRAYTCKHRGFYLPKVRAGGGSGSFWKKKKVYIAFSYH